MMIMMLGRRGLWRGCMGDNDVRGGRGCMGDIDVRWGGGGG